MQADIIKLSNLSVLDEKENKIPVYLLWQKQTAILVFIRHFSCIACRAHAKSVWSEKEKYQVNGAKIYFIGNGQPNFIQGFKEDLGIEDAKVYTDPSLKTFRAAGFKKGFFSAVSFQSMKNVKDLYNQGHKSTAYKKGSGNIWQLGGILAVKPSGQAVYHFISDSAGDFPPEDEIKAFETIERIGNT